MGRPPVIISLGFLLSLCPLLPAETISFAREVQPILSDKCYYCHGPDAGKREAGLRLDTFDGATAKLKDSPGQAVVPGNPGASEAVRRMRSKDANSVMPPPGAHRSMSEAEIAALEEWIRQGARYEPHWAFAPLPESVPVPVAGDGWARNEIDRFIIARLEKEGIKPSPEAEPARLLRRASFDLNGLPPAPEDAARAGALDYESMVDAFLASPRYGETMAVPWLDAARYADSYGYQSDQLMPQWPWRDWVIRAFNENLPFDQFLTWQLAGDLLPEPTRDQVLATAFNRLNRMTQEGGAVHEEYRAEGVADRLHTFGTTFLALTMECARCHDHKYDPITARDYYSLGAFFNSIAERGVYSHESIVAGPSLLLPTAEQEKRMRAALDAVAAGEKELSAALAAPAPASLPAEITSLPGRLARFDFNADGPTFPNTASPAPKEANANGLATIESPSGRAIAFTGDAGVRIPGLLEADWPQPWTIDIMARDAAGNPEPVVLWQRTFGTDAGYNGYECLLAGGRVEARVVRDWPGSAAAVRTGPVLVKNQWHRITITWDGSGKAGGLAIYIDGKTQMLETTADNLRQSVIARSFGDGHFTIGERFRDRGFTGGAVDSMDVFHRALAPLEVEELHAPGTLARAMAAPGPEVLEVHRAAIDPRAMAARDFLTKARLGLVAVESGVHAVAVMKETPEPRPAWIHARGDYTTPRTAENTVNRDVFSQVLPPFPADQPRDRLGLARWLLQPGHPLTARVFVNRVWQQFFGTGLVATADNFGFQGTPPSHPELLDWLARDFINHGWDVKRLCRQIATSATYRQDSRLTPELRERDPRNLLLARGPAHRLAAEPIRDLALAASGLLVNGLGGPPVSPYQPGPDLWRETNSMSPPYRQSTGDDLRRRSVYSVWKRTAPLPNATLFDAAGRETCVIRRGATNTPLQALVLLNDPQFTGPARALAASVLKLHPAGPEARLSEAFLRLAGRHPDPRELDILLELLGQQRGIFREKPEQASAFLNAAGHSPEPGADPVELAATAVACQAILNLDAVIWKR